MKRRVLALMLTFSMLTAWMLPVSAAGILSSAKNEDLLSSEELRASVASTGDDSAVHLTSINGRTYGTYSSGFRVPAGLDASLAENESSSGSGTLSSERLSIPSSYSLVSDNAVSAVTSQNPYGDCWAFASIASAESNLIRKGLAGTSINLSELQNAYFTWNRKDATQPTGCEGDTITWKAGDYLNFGGDDFLVITHLANWVGAVDEADAPYGNAASYAPGDAGSAYQQNKYVLTNARMVNMQDRNTVKNMMMTYGALSTAVYMNTDSFYNPATAAYYYNGSGPDYTNHAVTLVGWDDGYSKDNFRSDVRPSSDGAWLIKNSWGPSFGLSGYFWVSYEDAQISKYTACSYEMAQAQPYAHIYQYDGAAGTNSIVGKNTYYMANEFSAGSRQELKAVSFYTQDINVGYTVRIYRQVSDKPSSGTLVGEATTSGTMAESGYHTVPLSGSVTLESGEKFAVSIQLSKSGNVNLMYEGNGSSSYNYDGFAYDFAAHADAGESFFSSNGSSWYDLKASYGQDGNFRIKAFTDDAAAGSNSTNSDSAADSSGGATESSAAPSRSNVKMSRISGDDRYATAARIASNAFSKSSEAILVSGENFPDALAATALAGAKGCPMLITSKGILPNDTKTLLGSSGLNVHKVTIVGGEGAVSSAVADTVRQMGIDVTRISGEDRIETSEKIYTEGVNQGYFADSTACVVAFGYKSADILSIAPWSYYYKMPIFLTDASGNLSASSLALVHKFSKVYVLGGTSAVSDSSFSAIGNAQRISGGDRYETSMKIAQEFASAGGTIKGSDGSNVTLTTYYNNTAFASGYDSQFPDALVGGMLQARQTMTVSGVTCTVPAPMLLINSTSDATFRFVQQVYPKASGTGAVSQLYVLTGTGVISDELMGAIRDAAGV